MVAHQVADLDGRAPGHEGGKAEFVDAQEFAAQ